MAVKLRKRQNPQYDMWSDVTLVKTFIQKHPITTRSLGMIQFQIYSVGGSYFYLNAENVKSWNVTPHSMIVGPWSFEMILTRKELINRLKNGNVFIDDEFRRAQSDVSYEIEFTDHLGSWHRLGKARILINALNMYTNMTMKGSFVRIVREETVKHVLCERNPHE